VAGGLRLRLGGGIVALGNLSGLTAFLFAFRGWFNGPHLDHNVASAKRVSNDFLLRVPAALVLVICAAPGVRCRWPSPRAVSCVASTGWAGRTKRTSDERCAKSWQPS